MEKVYDSFLFILRATTGGKTLTTELRSFVEESHSQAAHVGSIYRVKWLEECAIVFKRPDSLLMAFKLEKREMGSKDSFRSLAQISRDAGRKINVIRILNKIRSVVDKMLWK